jgi:plastocyanin
MRKALVISAAFLAMLGSSALAYSEKTVEKGATLKGVVRFAGDLAKANQKDSSTKDSEACGTEHDKPDLVVDTSSRALSDVVVYFKSVEAGRPWRDDEKKIVIDQKKCIFCERHVALVAAGGEVVFKNSDSVLHNVSLTCVANKSFNEGVGPGASMTKKFDRPELVRISCSIHPWMSAVIVVMSHPYYAVSNERGEFSITDIPAGKYTVFVQHPELGRVEKKGVEIELKEGETVTRDFEFK